jgi:ribose/xylose/arabinose/galactoside ABC-type transport system permease subunit
LFSKREFPQRAGDKWEKRENLTKMVFRSDMVQTLGRSSFLGLPWAIWIVAAVACAAWIPLTQTS